MREWLPIIVSEHAFRRAAARVDPATLERWRPRGIRAGAADEVRAGVVLDRCLPRAPRWAQYTRREFVYVLDAAGGRCWVCRDYADCLLVVTVLLRPPDPPARPPPPDDAYRLRAGMTRRPPEARPPPRLSC